MQAGNSQLARGPVGTRKRICLSIRIALRWADRARHEALDRLRRCRARAVAPRASGRVRLIAAGVWMKGIVEEITEDRSIDDLGISRKKRVSRDQRSGSRRNI